MFNRQPFNRGKFNSSNLESRSASGIGLMIMSTNMVNATRTISAGGISSLKLGSTGISTSVKYNGGKAELLLGGKGTSTKVLLAGQQVADMVMTTKGEQTISGEKMIKIVNLILKPGDELIINTCDMTATLNGQNATEYISGDSDIDLTLLSGENSIEYSDSSASRKIAFDVIWKDRWL